ncbi:hypothetical protein THICB2_570020 [Thiomonas sp. CB2]|nr:hypothetical protein THICB2_570020 [Thiomonas sp. CB2]VDY04127.1 protein of unknown function [Thiomonas sp. Bio17B3]VDY08700.1 protein of unknown function [Thiomonas sp. Sup16B3]VDY12374.1 conserved protein of unknown function [Thiomonas sp. OC7]VDY18413.1 protein of unknown function [Thiomonas sp. CB2]
MSRSGRNRHSYSETVIFGNGLNPSLSIVHANIFLSSVKLAFVAHRPFNRPECCTGCPVRQQRPGRRDRLARSRRLGRGRWCAVLGAMAKRHRSGPAPRRNE